MKKPDKETRKWLLGLNDALQKAKNGRERKKIIKEFKESLYNTAKVLEIDDAFKFLFVFRFEVLPAILEEEKITLHEEIEILFLTELQDLIKKPSQLAMFLNAVLPSAGGLNPMTSHKMVEATLEVIGFFLQNFKPKEKNEEMKGEGMILGKLAELLDPYIEKAKRSSFADEPLNVADEDGKEKKRGTMYFLLHLIQICLWKISGSIDGDGETFKRVQKYFDEIKNKKTTKEPKEPETPISKDAFGDAKQGTRIIDANGDTWTFADIPINRNPVSDAVRILTSPEGETSRYRHTNVHGRNNIMDEEWGIMLELNHPDVRLIS